MEAVAGEHFEVGDICRYVVRLCARENRCEGAGGEFVTCTS